MSCAPSWDRESLIHELDYVGRIFRWSEDSKGRKLFWKCEEIIDKLKGGLTEPVVSRAISFSALSGKSKSLEKPDTSLTILLKFRSCSSGLLNHRWRIVDAMR
ncbi:hypothetical protein POM88_020715 [Heracleum sosnowskyi]|uniref:Uncharacterized protein n=1 Tax=Heracleum sosnowskyi TaxID=360622 RepID=A0AAD8MNC7_9APIA|nr:hypothetical protein POM88_020715 [Heracleum sosnowskyi]